MAVAGSSLLTGCGSYSAMQKDVGTINTVLKVVTKLEQVEYDAANTTTIFKLTVTNGPDTLLSLNALKVTAENFTVTADGYLAAEGQNLRVTSPDALNHQVKEGETRTFLCVRKGSECTGEGGSDPYLLSSSAEIQRLQRQLGVEQRRSEGCHLHPFQNLTRSAGRTYW